MDLEKNEKTDNQPVEQEAMLSIRDLYLATTLVSLKFPMVGIDYQIEGEKNAPVGYFKFKITPELLEAKNKYIQGMLLVEPNTFVTNMRSLKGEVMNVYRGPSRF
jgi:hypothetical protein